MAEHTPGSNTIPAEATIIASTEHHIKGTKKPRKAAPVWQLCAVLTVTALLAAACWRLYATAQNQGRYAVQLAGDLSAARGALEQASSDLAAVRSELAAAQSELAAARETIDLLAEYSAASPDGTAPEYTTLFPGLYAPAWTGETVDGGRVCCLTFDDGPSANTDRVLEILDRYGVKATFFVVGKTGEADQARMRKIVAAGHTLAMHGWSHDYRKIYASVEAFLEDFDRLYRWIYEVTGTYPQVYRFPGGSLNGYDRGVYQEIVAEMTRRGFVYFDWNASAQDATNRPRPAADIAADCLKGVGRDLVVVLAHDSAARGTTVDALPAVIEGYQQAGYTFSALHPGVCPIFFGYPSSK